MEETCAESTDEENLVKVGDSAQYFKVVFEFQAPLVVFL